MDYKVARFVGLKELTDEGSFVATIATLNHVDLDGDVTLPGAFPEGKQVHIARWGHDWSDLPYGVATLHQDGTEQQAHGRFNLETTHGRDAYHTVKAARAIQEWSYGFFIEDAEFGEFNGQEVRFLKKLDVAEISPVMRGAAGPGMTRVEDIKGSGLTMDEQAETALTAVAAFLKRVGSLTDLRDSQGRKRISRANAERISRVHAGIVEAMPALEELLALTRDGDDSEPADAPKGIDPLSLELEAAHLDATLKRLGIPILSA